MGLIYFKLISPYQGDVTKNTTLDMTEIDSNFYTLESRDIKRAYWEQDTLILEMYDGNVLRVSGITEGCAKNLEFTYNQETGTLNVTNNGVTQAITGFTSGDALTNVNTDETLNGSGTKKCPLKISPLVRPGQIRPVRSVVDMTNGEALPDPRNLSTGDRFITVEQVSEYGYLYNYSAVRKIINDLVDSCSPWRVPTKEDWDDMLNAVEPCAEDRTHNRLTCNIELGRFAGKLLKSENLWDLEPTNACDTGNTNVGCGTVTATTACTSRYVNPCYTTCGEYVDNTPCQSNPYPNKGVDKFGFGAVPAGYGDDGGCINYFGERGFYWTATNQASTTAYAKRFAYNRSTVYQEIINTNNLLSIRLVKDYDGTNFNERESILGFDYSCVLMPSLSSGKKIWMSTNLALTNQYYCPVLPNNGINLVCSTKYFVNEWNGHRWIKGELHEGESVVVKDASTGDLCVEYRLINGVLTNVDEKTYDKVIDTVGQDLDSIRASIAAETNRAKEVEENLNNLINSETSRAVAAENGIISQLANEINRAQQSEANLLQQINNLAGGSTTNLAALAEKIDNEIARATEAEDVIDQKVEAEVTRATEAENKLTADLAAEVERATLAEGINEESINNEVARATAAEAELDSKITAETERAVAKEAELDDKIAAETSRAMAKEEEIIGMINGDSGLSSLISAETAARIAADEQLQANIDSEAEARSAADTQLQNDLQTEAEARIAADNDILAKLENQSGSIEESIAEVNKRIDEEVEKLNTALAGEAANREAGDNALQDNLDEITDVLAQEQTSRINGDEANKEAIEAEAVARQEEDAQIRDTFDNAIEEESLARQNADAEIIKRLIVENGCVMSAKDGTLILAAEDPEKNIVIKLDFDFGEI